ncbi:hypothetical protein ACFFP0_25105 [Rhizobium puerariae]|uniref:Uncharacterized protein n=1 Tax=Rhizobium puerariae TaxID=1585791 RepID=A0ABV6AQY4_9HYPH
MPPLISYMLVRISIGFTLGAAAAVAILAQAPDFPALSMIGLIAIWLMVYGLGSIFGLGYLATSLAFDAEK